MIIFVFLQIYLFFIKNFQVLDHSGYLNEFPLPLFGENKKTREVRQTFETPGPLARIDIMLANYLIKPKGGTIQLGIFKGNQCFFLKKYPANRAEDNKFYTFTIDSSKVPPGTYDLHLKYFRDNKKERLAVWIHQKDIYPHGQLYVNGKLREGDMNFRVYYLSTIWQQRHHLIKKIPPLWLSRFWLISGFFFTILTLNFLFYYFINKLLGSTDP